MLDRLGLNALSYRPFRAWFGANLSTNASWFIYSAGFGWLVLGLTGSPATVGFAYFISGLPQLLLTLHAGLLTDRFGARRLIAISFAVSGTLLFALGIVALVPGTPLWLVIGLALFAGISQTLGGPGYIAISNDLVPPGIVSSAVSLTFLGFNVGRITGGLLGGILVAAFPAGWALIVAALMQGLPSLVVWRLRTAPVERHAGSSNAMVRPLVEAAMYAARLPSLGVLLLLAIAPGAVGLSYNYLLPVAAKEFGIGGEGLGALLAATGAGGLAAGLGAERLMRSYGHGAMVFVGLATAAGGMIAFGLAPSPLIAIPAMSFVGGGFLLYGAASLSLIQALSPARLRGRLTSLFQLLYWGLMPIGGLIGGAVAQATSARFMMGASGVIIMAAGVLAIMARREIAYLRVGRDGAMRGEVRPADLAA